MSKHADLRWVRERLQAADWQFAKTMPETPHWYTLRRTWLQSADFERAVRIIRKYGYTAYFRGRPYVYLDIDDMQYWTMGAPVRETTLINRAYRERERA